MKKSLLLLLALVLGWFVVSEAATEGWYRWHEMRAEKSPEWKVTWPDDPESDWTVQDFTEFPTSDQVQEVLRYDEMRGARWLDPASRVTWNVNFIEWEPDNDLNGINAVHNPTICLPSAGMELVETLGPKNVEIGTENVPFQCFLFETAGRKLYVFSTANQKLKMETATYSDSALGMRASRLEPMESGNRQGPEQVLHVYLMGPRSFDEALAELKSGLDKFVKAESAGKSA